MSNSAAPSLGYGGYWLFLDSLVQTEAVRKIQHKRTKGDALISELKRCPVMDFGLFKIDFNDDEWDFTKVTELNIPNTSLRIRFDDSPLRDLEKLYCITGILWRKAKVQSFKSKCIVIASARKSLALTPSSVRLLSKEQVAGYVDALRPNLAPTTLATYVAYFCEFLEFYERLFGKLADPDVIPHLQEMRRAFFLAGKGVEGFPRIPQEYEEALLDAIDKVMSDESASQDDIIVAAAMTILSELGFRVGELCSLEVDSIEVMKGEGGLPDIAELSFKSYKGEKGDGSYRLLRTVLSAKALDAYLLLEEACRASRERLGVKTLIVFPRQELVFCSRPALSQQIKKFLLRHSDLIPCINSEHLFPELPTMSVSGVAMGQELRDSLSASGVAANDSLVYVTPHMFRVSFATRLYERGYDLDVISKYMNHISPEITCGYIRSERAVERSMSDAVYRAMLVDEAKLLGPNAEGFTELVKGYAESLEGSVYEDDEALIAACSERYALRLKPGYVCTKCGNIRGCPSSDGTDEAFCAFGVCRNQHSMYFMVDVHLESVRFHMSLVEENKGRGHVRASENELRKARNVIEGTILPELESLDEQIGRHGEEHILRRHPHLRGVVENRDELKKEIESWLAM